MNVDNLQNLKDKRICQQRIDKVKKLVDSNSTIVINKVKEDKINKIVNIRALLDLINEAMSDIRIYTDSIKDEVHGDDLFVKEIINWVVRYPHHRLKILLKTEQENLKSRKLYKALSQLDPEYKRQVDIRFLKDADTEFNCFVADRSSYKLRLIDEDKVYLSFNDTNGVAKTMNVIFNHSFKGAKKIPEFKTVFNISEFINQFFKTQDDKAFSNTFYAKKEKPFSIPVSFSDIHIAQMAPQVEELR